MAKVHDPRRRFANLRVRGFLLALVAVVSLAGGCVPANVPVATAPTAPLTPPPAAVATSQPAGPSPAAATTVPTAVPSPLPTLTPVAASPLPTATSLASPLPTPLASTGSGIVVQSPDNSIQVTGIDGKQTLLYRAGGQADLSSIFPPGNSNGTFLYVPVSGSPPSLVRVDSSGGQALSSVASQLFGVAPSETQLAFGTADLSTNPPAARIMVGELDGTQARDVLQVSSPSGMLPQVLRVMRWSADGSRLFFGKEPIGLGGYILFSGLTNLWAYDPVTGKATEVVPRPAPNAAVCIDDLSPNEKLAADHCNPAAMEIIDLTTQMTTTVRAPAEVTGFHAVGGARFSPDGKQLAYALARRDPENEQGWVALADATGGASRLVVTSPAKDYFSVAAWLDGETLILQSGGQKPGVWTVGTDGSGLARVADGTFLGTLGRGGTGGQG